MRHWDGHGYGHGHQVGGWGLGLMVILGLLVLAVLVLAVVALVRHLARTPRPVPPGAWGAGGTAAVPPGRAASPTPEQLLAERFARGEIDAEEYRHRLETLRAANGAGAGPGSGGSG
ncbi:SHOCT domain-containing protein [Kitasatospora sp. NBC_01560]|uniref:SHOCT domain-containing protein n=1 Tax=Kitasatospora sp. NBC_01560 TaxID=2975965 RepID=UPI0038652E50